MVTREKKDATPVQVTLAEAVAELDAMTGDIPALKLTEGDVVLGMVVEYQQYESKFNGGFYQVATLRLSDGDYGRLAIGAAALRGAFGRLKPRPGETVRLQRLADGDSANKPQRYRLRVLGREAVDAVPDFGAPDDEPAVGVSAPPTTDPDVSHEELKEAVPF